MDHTLIIGLGNPDPTLEETYHNVGALAVRWVAEHDAPEGGAPLKFRVHGDLFCYIKNEGHIFIRPLVFMNESGRAVRELCAPSARTRKISSSSTTTATF